MDQPPNNDSKISKTNSFLSLNGQKHAPSPDGRADADPAPGGPPLASGLVRLSEGTVAGASDEALTVVIAEATCLAKEAQRELERRATEREAEFLEMVRQQALALGVTPARLAAAIAGKAFPRTRTNGDSDGRSVVLPKYRDPADPARTWSGRGNAPPWIELDPATGKPLAKFHIREGEE